MRYIRVKVTDPELEEALERLPRGATGEFVRRALRAYLLPGGQAEVLGQLEAMRGELRDMARRMEAMETTGIGCLLTTGPGPGLEAAENKGDELPGAAKEFLANLLRG